MNWYVWYVPGAAALTSSAAYMMVPAKPALLSDMGLVSGIIQIMALLPGFFITALAAVATFQRPEMDEEMPKPTPSVKIRREGRSFQIPLTRRLFLSYLFSYLSILSIVIFSICIWIRIVAPAGKAWITSVPNVALQRLMHGLAEFLVILILAYLCASLFVAMLHGIFFIAERIHQPH